MVSPDRHDRSLGAPAVLARISWLLTGAGKLVSPRQRAPAQRAPARMLMSSDAVTLPSAGPRPAARLAGTVPGSPPAPASRAVQDGLELVVTRAAVVFRGAWCAVTPLLAFANGAAASTLAARAVAAAVVVGWGATFWLVCRRRTLPAWLVTADAVIYAGLLLAMPVILPGPLSGDSGGGVFGSAPVSILLASWRLPRRAAAAVTIMEMGAYLGGLALGGAALSSSLTNVVTFGVQFVIGLTVIGVMRRSAQAADTALDHLESAHRQSAVDEARLRDRHAQRLALHDTVLTTLTAIARGGLAGRADLIRGRCRQDLDCLSATRPAGPRDQPVPVEELVARVRGEAAARDLVAGVTLRSPALVLRAD